MRLDFGFLVARSFEIMWKYRALWLFGFLLALTGGAGGSGNSNAGSAARGLEYTEPAPTGWPSWISQQTILTVIAVVVCVIIIWFFLSLILRFVSRAALIGLVSELEQNQVKPTARRGFSIGADRFWPLLGIALLVNIPVVVVSLVLVLLAAIPLLVTLLPGLSTGSRGTPDQWSGLLVTGGATSVLLFCCVILFLVLLQVIIRPFYEFFVRACVIGRRGALDAIQEGYRIVRANMGNSILLYILVIAIGFAYGLLMIPIGLILLGIAAISGFAVGSAANSVLAGIAVAAVIGIPVLLVLFFVAGLYEVFESTLWTEGFLGMTRPPAAPALAETPATG